jgi:dolichyl-phosphate beta-glucosyltransferase
MKNNNSSNFSSQKNSHIQKKNLKVQDNPYLSVIIPVYNETHRLKNLHTIANFLKKQTVTSELIIVDDGSDKEQKKLLEKISKQLHCTVISYKKNRGKGYAVKTGMLKANGKKRLFIDVDLSTPIEESKKFITNKTNGQIVIGSRKIKGSKLIIRQPYVREVMGKFFTLLSQIILQLQVSDFTCGIKCFDKEAAETIFKSVTINRWGFDPELLFIAKQNGFSITEIPVTWQHDQHTRVRFPRDIIISFVDLITIRVNHLKGKYKKTT